MLTSVSLRGTAGGNSHIHNGKVICSQVVCYNQRHHSHLAKTVPAKFVDFVTSSCCGKSENVSKCYRGTARDPLGRSSGTAGHTSFASPGPIPGPVSSSAPAERPLSLPPSCSHTLLSQIVIFGRNMAVATTISLLHCTPFELAAPFCSHA